MATNIRWGILGAGRIAGDFATALNYTAGAELYAVASTDAEKGKAFAKRFGAPTQYTRYESLAKDPGVDIIYIATPHAFHYEHTLLCLRHGKAVLCEKPLALNYRQAAAMAEEARQRELFLMEGMWTRFMPSLNKAKQLIDVGIIGDLRYVQADFGFATDYNPQGRLFNRALGGGSLLDVGVYPVFLSCFLMGKPTAIQALAGKAPTGTDEYCHALLQYSGGRSAHIFSAVHVATGLQAEIAGTHGRIILARPWYKSEELRVEPSDGVASSYSFPWECNGFEYEIQEVMECLENGFKECPAMPLDLTLQMSEVMEEIGRVTGVNY